jgi:hypothetical protein
LLHDAAKDILSKSFTIFKLDDPTTQKVKIAHREAIEFFHESIMNQQQQQQQQDCMPYQRIVNGNLYGYNEPSPSKLLFRSYCYCREENTIQQPWPNLNFEKASTNLVTDLHVLLETVYQQIQLHFNNRRCKTTSHPITKSSSSSPPPRKRIRQDNIIVTSYDGGEETMEITKNSHQFMLFDRSKCPLDYFFYHNQTPSFENCSEHVDRGVLILVCLTNVPGLEVYYDPERGGKQQNVHHHQQQQQTFICPEILVHNANLYKEVEDSCSNLVCIMAGDQLSQLLLQQKQQQQQQQQKGISQEEGTNIDETTPDLPRACVHRVRNNLKRTRLSMSYEIRL